MMAALTPLLAAYSIEILLLVAIATAAAWLVRVPPRGRHILWRSVVIACLMLPLAPPRVVQLDLVPTTSAELAIGQAPSTLPATLAHGPTTSRLGLIPWIAFAGAFLRTPWLGVGLVRLRTLKRRSTSAVLSE